MKNEKKHLWEIKHPFYCADSNYYTTIEKSLRVINQNQEEQEKFLQIN